MSSAKTVAGMRKTFFMIAPFHSHPAMWVGVKRPRSLPGRCGHYACTDPASEMGHGNGPVPYDLVWAELLGSSAPLITSNRLAQGANLVRVLREIRSGRTALLTAGGLGRLLGLTAHNIQPRDYVSGLVSNRLV